MANSPYYFGVYIFVCLVCYSLVIFISRKSVKCIQKTPQWTAQNSIKAHIYSSALCLGSVFFCCFWNICNRSMLMQCNLFIPFFFMFWCCGCCLRNIYTFFVYFFAFRCISNFQNWIFFYIVQNIKKIKIKLIAQHLLKIHRKIHKTERNLN